MRIYNPNPKHELSGSLGRKGARMDLTPGEAVQLLNDPVNCLTVTGQRQYVGVRGGRIYVFMDDNAGGYHGYPVSGCEAYQKYPQIARRLADLLGTTVKRLSRMDDV